MECEQTQTLVVLTDIKIPRPYVDNIGKTTPSSLLATRYLHFTVKCDFIKLFGSAQPGALHSYLHSANWVCCSKASMLL